MPLTYCEEHGYTPCFAKYCGKCGKPTKEYPRCIKCGEQFVIIEQDYCYKCGTKRPDNQERGK